MRGARKRSSGADIRTTGFVQLDASRPKKRARRHERAAEEQKALAEDIQAAESSYSKEEGATAAAAESVPQMCKETPKVPVAEVPKEKKKSLRQFARSRNQSPRKPPETTTQCKRKKSEASTEMIVLGETKPPEAPPRRSSRQKFVNLHQLAQDMMFLEDEEEDQQLVAAEAKMKTVRRSKKESVQTAKKNKDQLEMIEECLSFLEEMGVFNTTSLLEDGPAAIHLGLVGDGSSPENCKICGRPEDGSTLVCDTCEESFHMSCCYPRIRTKQRDDRWLCSVCTRKRKKKSAELKIFPGGHFDEKLPASWKIDKTKVRGWDLERMERTHVRVGSKYQAEVPEWTGGVFDEKLPRDYPGFELPRSLAEKLEEKIMAEFNVSNNIWPMGWLPVTNLPEGERENWLQCQNIMFEEGDSLPDGQVATKDVVCGKWRRAPMHIVADEGWECSCALAWDPRHADCAVPQEVPTEDLRKRPKARMQSPAEDSWRYTSGKRMRIPGFLQC